MVLSALKAEGCTPGTMYTRTSSRTLKNKCQLKPFQERNALMNMVRTVFLKGNFFYVHLKLVGGYAFTPGALRLANKS